MNEAELARRIYDNLNWARTVGGSTKDGPVVPWNVWSQVKAVWRAPDRQFVQGLYLALLFRPADRVGLTLWCGALTGGMSRADLVRSLARSDEARKCCLDLSWLPELDKLPPPRRRLSLRSLKALFRAAIRPGAVWSKIKAGAARCFGLGKRRKPEGDL